ncbi:hypothetical protein Nepgr_008336 [Nepenthes gracilis]|uniref:Uncharacterized protein n=1 Tax=Nepenthes gracilis TaxID=150966 RepID=A0AAD3XJC3_NEPGR|nr:hypothetical protein Nepgr_008336 [Nepenthes gracilis]
MISGENNCYGTLPRALGRANLESYGDAVSIDSSERGFATSALTSEFFTTKSFSCGPSSLPKSPPTKEFDAKVRDEESRRRQVAVANKGHRLDPKSTPTSKSRSEKINRNQEVVSSGFPIAPPRPFQAVEESKNSHSQAEIVTMGQAQFGLMRLSQTYGTVWDTSKSLSGPLQFDLWYQFWKKLYGRLF